MRQIIWQPSKPPVTLRSWEAIHSMILAAGIPLETAGVAEGGYLLNFADDASDEQITQALQIAEQFDPPAREAQTQRVRDAREADLRPFKAVHILVDDNLRDIGSLDNATLDELKPMLKRLLEREQQLLKAVARLINQS